MNPNEPEPKTDCIEPPFELSSVAQKHWDKTLEQLLSANIMTNIDSTALAAYCETYATWVDAVQKVKRHGAVIKGPSGFPVRSPYFAVAERSLAAMNKMLVEFGMTPASRTKVSATAPKEENNNPFSKITKKSA